MEKQFRCKQFCEYLIASYFAILVQRQPMHKIPRNVIPIGNLMHSTYYLGKICIHNYDVSVRVMYCCCTASIPADNWLVLILLGASGLIGEGFYYSW